jgi:leukotriene-A4 hydrolase
MGLVKPKQRHDPNTLSNYDQFITVHTTVNLSIDFEQKILSGNIQLDLLALVDPKENDLFLDASFLEVQDVTVRNVSSKWSVLPRSEPYGGALRISLEDTAESHLLNVDVSP